MGLGFFTTEEVITDLGTGRLITDGTWEYKIPAATCIPRQLNVTFLKVASLMIISFDLFFLFWHLSFADIALSRVQGQVTIV